MFVGWINVKIKKYTFPKTFQMFGTEQQAIEWVEFFAGLGNLTVMMRASEYVSARFDVLDHCQDSHRSSNYMDLTHQSGFGFLSHQNVFWNSCAYIEHPGIVNQLYLIWFFWIAENQILYGTLSLNSQGSQCWLCSDASKIASPPILGSSVRAFPKWIWGHLAVQLVLPLDILHINQSNWEIFFWKGHVQFDGESVLFSGSKLYEMEPGMNSLN